MNELTVDKLLVCRDELRQIPQQGIIFAHPDQHYALSVLSARAKWKHEQWIPRWERWSGEKHVEIEGELGTWLI